MHSSNALDAPNRIREGGSFSVDWHHGAIAEGVSKEFAVETPAWDKTYRPTNSLCGHCMPLRSLRAVNAKLHTKSSSTDAR